MNSCVLMAEIISDPQLRYTQDSQLAITEMLVQFPGVRAEDPMGTLKVISWGNLAQQIQEQFHTGDRVVLEGRLGMNTIERPEGFKEKRAELTVSRIHPLAPGQEWTVSAAASVTEASASATAPAPTVAKPAAIPVAQPTPAKAAPKAAAAGKKVAAAPVVAEEPNYDDIPF